MDDVLFWLFLWSCAVLLLAFYAGRDFEQNGLRGLATPAFILAIIIGLLLMGNTYDAGNGRPTADISPNALVEGGVFQTHSFTGVDDRGYALISRVDCGDSIWKWRRCGPDLFIVDEEPPEYFTKVENGEYVEVPAEWAEAQRPTKEGDGGK